MVGVGIVFDRSDKRTASCGLSIAQSFSNEVAKALPFVTSFFPVRMKNGFVPSREEDLFEKASWNDTSDAASTHGRTANETQLKKRRIA